MNDDIAQQIINWLKAQLRETSTQGFILGLSGGLDSSVCAALIKKATDNCLGLILPIESNVEDLDDAAEVAAQFHMKTEYVDLTPIYHSLTRLLPDKNRLALGNIKARLRMVVLYYYANLRSYLVCGTGNKTEITLGYFTKYGDGASDVLPIGDMSKGEVKELARKLDVPQRIINKVPSAGLWAGQTDEGEIGFTYEEIDVALEKIEKEQITEPICLALSETIKKTAHKRETPKIFRLRR